MRTSHAYADALLGFAQPPQSALDRVSDRLDTTSERRYTAGVACPRRIIRGRVLLVISLECRSGEQLPRARQRDARRSELAPASFCTARKALVNPDLRTDVRSARSIKSGDDDRGVRKSGDSRLGSHGGPFVGFPI